MSAELEDSLYRVVPSEAFGWYYLWKWNEKKGEIEGEPLVVRKGSVRTKKEHDRLEHRKEARKEKKQE